MSDVLKKADAIAGENRDRDYGHPRDNFQRIAGLWDQYLRNKPGRVGITADDIAPMMILLKIARQQGTPKPDNLVDIAGYTKCLDMLREPALGPLEELGFQTLQPHDDGGTDADRR